MLLGEMQGLLIDGPACLDSVLLGTGSGEGSGSLVGVSGTSPVVEVPGTSTEA